MSSIILEFFLNGVSFMFNSIQYVRDICKQRKLPISKLERDCGFANGYLNPQKLQKLPYDRAAAIARYLDLSLDYLLTGEERKDTPADPGGQKISDAELKFALWGDSEIMDDADLEDVRRYAAFVRERKKERK